jgi:serine/threonine protein kinase
MVTGKRAFDGKSQFKVASAILEDDPQPVRKIQPDVPRALENAVRACLSKDPNEPFSIRARHRHATEVDPPTATKIRSSNDESARFWLAAAMVQELSWVARRYTS